MAGAREFAASHELVREVEKHPERRFTRCALRDGPDRRKPATWLMARYREDFDPEVMTAALAWFSEQVGADALDRMLLHSWSSFRIQRDEGAGNAAAMAGGIDRWHDASSCCDGRAAAVVDGKPE